jgi:calcineurin-like phosphoesterase family protein
MIYFTADPHIYHERAVKFPGRTEFTPESWAEMFFDLVNSKVTKHDRLFILGDFALGAGLAPFVKARPEEFEVRNVQDKKTIGFGKLEKKDAKVD